MQSLQNKLRALVPATRAAVRQAVATAALLTESDAKRLAPVDTGRLRSAIHAELSSNGLRATVLAEDQLRAVRRKGDALPAGAAIFGAGF